MKRQNDIDKDGLNDVIHLSKKLLRVFYIITILGIFLGLIIVLKQLQLFSIIFGILGVLSPLAIGFIIAWLFYPLYRKLTSKGLNKILSAIIIFLGLVAIIVLFIYIFIPILYEQVNDLISYVPNVLTEVTGFITSSLDKIHIDSLDVESLKQGLLASGEEAIVSITSSLPNGIISLVKGAVSAAGVILISLVIGLYMLIDFDNITVSMHKLLPKKGRNDYIKLIDNIGLNTRKVVNSTLFVASLVFVFDTIGFALVGLNSAFLFGLFCGITDLIPYIGPYIGGGVAVIVGFTQSPIIGIGVLVIAIVVQIVESYVLQPVVMSKAMELRPVTIIVGLLLFGYFFGIVGMIIATPCMAIIKEIWMFIMLKTKKNAIYK